MLASSNGHDGCLRALLERGVCADIQDKVGVHLGHAAMSIAEIFEKDQCVLVNFDLHRGGGGAFMVD